MGLGKSLWMLRRKRNSWVHGEGIKDMESHPASLSALSERPLISLNHLIQCSPPRMYTEFPWRPLKKWYLLSPKTNLVKISGGLNAWPTLRPTYKMEGITQLEKKVMVKREFLQGSPWIQTFPGDCAQSWHGHRARKVTSSNVRAKPPRH